MSDIGKEDYVKPLSTHTLASTPSTIHLLKSLADDIDDLGKVVLGAWANAKGGKGWQMALVRVEEDLEAFAKRVKELLG